jgi:hypothetical protein
MKPILTGCAALAALALTARFAGAFALGSGEGDGVTRLIPTLSVPAAIPSAAAPVTESPRGCARGPQRASEMVVTPGGFLKARPPTNAAHHEFYFTRAMYSDGGRGGFGFRRGGDFLGDGGPAWSIDYPDADRHMMMVARRLSNLDACQWENPVSLADPDLRRFPFLFSLEWGYANLTEAEVEGLRDYLLAGGLLMLDDFWGSAEWANFEYQIRRVLPDANIIDIPRDHLIFRIYYDIDGEIIQVPNAGNGRRVGRGDPGATTSERDGYEPHVRGIFDDAGRLMVVINWNTDLGDALEWAEDESYPLVYSTFAANLFLNTIMYALTH